MGGAPHFLAAEHGLRRPCYAFDMDASARKKRGPVTFLAAAMLLGVATGAPGGTLDFALEDQFGRPHEASELEGRVVVLVAADRRAQASADAWVRALREELVSSRGEVAIVRILDLRGVPFFMRAMIRKGLSQRPDDRCLLDWDGQLARSHPLEGGVANLLVFDEEGRLVGRTSGASPEAESLASLVALVETARRGS